MKQHNEQLSALVDNELDDQQLLDELINDNKQQQTFSRYHLIGDVIRGEVVDQMINIDISQQILAKINITPVVSLESKLPQQESKVDVKEKSNVISFMQRFGQYAIAASVAGVVVASLLTSQPAIENGNSGLEVLNTVPFGGSASPVSLQAPQQQSAQFIKERNDRLEALFKDHQLQIQTQP